MGAPVATTPTSGPTSTTVNSAPPSSSVSASRNSANSASASGGDASSASGGESGSATGSYGSSVTKPPSGTASIIPQSPGAKSSSVATSTAASVHSQKYFEFTNQSDRDSNGVLCFYRRDCGRSCGQYSSRWRICFLLQYEAEARSGRSSRSSCATS